MKQSLEKGFVTPLPVYIIATYDENEQPNAMNAAWAGQIGRNQISISLGQHKSTDNIRLQKEFTVSFATADQMEACDYVGMVSGNKEPDKLAKCGFTVTKSDKVHAPIINELPVAIECKVIDLQEEFGELRVVAEIVGVQAEADVLTDGVVDLGKLRPIMYDSTNKSYRAIGEKLGDAWGAGSKFM